MQREGMKQEVSPLQTPSLLATWFSTPYLQNCVKQASVAHKPLSQQYFAAAAQTYLRHPYMPTARDLSSIHARVGDDLEWHFCPWPFLSNCSCSFWWHPCTWSTKALQGHQQHCKVLWWYNITSHHSLLATKAWKRWGRLGKKRQTFSRDLMVTFLKSCDLLWAKHTVY